MFNWKVVLSSLLFTIASIAASIFISHSTTAHAYKNFVLSEEVGIHLSQGIVPCVTATLNINVGQFLKAKDVRISLPAKMPNWEGNLREIISLKVKVYIDGNRVPVEISKNLFFNEYVIEINSDIRLLYGDHQLVVKYFSPELAFFYDDSWGLTWNTKWNSIGFSVKKSFVRVSHGKGVSVLGGNTVVESNGYKGDSLIEKDGTWMWNGKLKPGQNVMINILARETDLDKS
jgi:hypothetical protein